MLGEECDKSYQSIFSSSTEEHYLLRGVFRIHYLLKSADSLTHSLTLLFPNSEVSPPLQEYTVTCLTLDLLNKNKELHSSEASRKVDSEAQS